MRFSKHLVTLLILLAGFAYSIEATLPAIAAVVIENSSEETESNEKIESLVPAQTEAKRVQHNSTIKVSRHTSVKFLLTHSEQHFIKPPSIILHRKLLI